MQPSEKADINTKLDKIQESLKTIQSGIDAFRKDAEIKKAQDSLDIIQADIYALRKLVHNKD